MAGLYIHTPFCSQKCSYCDFFSAPPTANQLETWHLLIQRNLELIASAQTSEIETIFFGGGTPSLLAPDQIAHILTSCQNLLPVSPDAEISLEANPATLSPRRLEGFRAAGINRLSIGVQSLNDRTLKFLGRKHNALQARQVFHQARTAGFDNISLDLIFALPGRTTTDLRRELSQLLELAPDHLGIYGLSIEAGTPLAQRIDAGLLTETDEETYAASYLLLSRELSAANYEHYEISNFARPGFRCRHNQGYWQRKTCLAAGAGAHGFNQAGYGQRSAIPQDLHLYRQALKAGRDPAEPLEDFDRRQAMSETLYLALRTRDGLNRQAFIHTFGQSPEEAFPEAFCALDSRLQRSGSRLYFTPEDWLIYDHLISQFL